MKTKLPLTIIIASALSITAVSSFGQVASPEKQLPPLPPGLVYAENGTIKEVPYERIAGKAKQKDSALLADNPAPGSKIDEPAGAALPEKKPVKEVEAPK